MLIVGIAGLVIGIECRHSYLEKRCAAYATEGTPDFTVSVTDNMIEEEKARAVTVPAGAERPQSTFLRTKAALPSPVIPPKPRVISAERS